MDIFNYDDYENKIAGRSAEMMRKYGWYAHFVPGDEYCPNAINYHTHGVEDSFGHPDLQICFPLSPNIAHEIFAQVVAKIREGDIFIPGLKYPEIIGGDLLVEFIDVMESSRPVRRIIFPDQNGQYEGDAFKVQFNNDNLGEEEV